MAANLNDPMDISPRDKSQQVYDRPITPLAKRPKLNQVSNPVRKPSQCGSTDQHRFTVLTEDQLRERLQELRERLELQMRNAHLEKKILSNPNPASELHDRRFVLAFNRLQL